MAEIVMNASATLLPFRYNGSERLPRARLLSPNPGPWITSNLSSISCFASLHRAAGSLSRVHHERSIYQFRGVRRNPNAVMNRGAFPNTILLSAMWFHIFWLLRSPDYQRIFERSELTPV